MKIESPCIHLCRLDERDVCIGCLRTRSEIARWSQMTEWERFSITAALPTRGAVGSAATGLNKTTE
jgi:predicted Fe-S protein YdhL (DUF1289 family)